MLTLRTGKSPEGAAAMVTLAMFVSRRISAAPAGIIDRIELNSGPMNASHLGGRTASIAQAVLRRMNLYYVRLTGVIAAGMLLAISGVAIVAMTGRNGVGQSVAWKSVSAPYATTERLDGAQILNLPAAPDPTTQPTGQDSGNHENSVAQPPAASPEAAGPTDKSANAAAGAESRSAPAANAAPAPQVAANKDVIHIQMVKVPGEQWVGYVFQKQSGGSAASDDTAAYELVKINLHGMDAKPAWMLDLGSIVQVNTANPGRSLLQQLANIRQSRRP